MIKKNKKIIKKVEKKLKKGFTLIELLAVIIILGVLMIIAIPSVTEYINSSRKNTYITTVQGFIDGTTAKVNSLEYSVMDTEVTYYIPTKCISLEKGGDSPFGEFKESYVVVTYDGIGYDYYYTGRDSGNHGILLSYRELLENNFIDTGTKTIDTTVGVGSREKIMIFSDTCEKDLYEEKSATKLIKEEGTLRDGFTQLSVPTDESCFGFNSSTGTITNYYCGMDSAIIHYEVDNVEACVKYLTDNGKNENEARLTCQNDQSASITMNELLENGEFYDNEISNLIDMGAIKKIKDKSGVELNVVIPKIIQGTTVSAIGEYAFSESEILTIELPNTITSIGDYAFIDNPLLYNIINRTGKSFNWADTIGHYSSSSTFVIGTLKAGRCDNNIILQVTDKRVDYNLDNVFETDYDECNGPSNIRYVTLLDDKGYNIQYLENCETDENTWNTFEKGKKLKNNDEYIAYNNLNNNLMKLNTLAKKVKYSVEPVICYCSSLKLRILKDNEVVFSTYFDYRTGCK